MLTVYSIAFANIQECCLFLALHIPKTSYTKVSNLSGEFQNSKRESGKFNRRPPGFSLECMYRSIHKVRTGKGLLKKGETGLFKSVHLLF